MPVYPHDMIGWKIFTGHHGFFHGLFHEIWGCFMQNYLKNQSSDRIIQILLYIPICDIEQHRDIHITYIR